MKFTDIYVDDEIVERVGEALGSSRYVKGPIVEEFEREFSDRCGTEHAVGVSSGTAALYISLDALDIGPGDEVFVPGHTFFATVSPVLKLGATPVFVDVDPERYTLDPNDLESKVKSAENPRAVIPVHIYGQTAEMIRISKIAKRYNLSIIEDGCQSHLATLNGATAGTFGDIGCFSFYPSKNMTVGGDGGMIVTDDQSIEETVRTLRNHGRDLTGEHRRLGLNFRLDEIKAAVGLEQLKYLPQWNERRNKAAQLYTNRLSRIDEVTPPTEGENVFHVYHLYVIQAERRDKLRTHLSERGVPTAIHYETPAHDHRPIRERVGDVSLPVTEQIVENIVSLPMHPRLTETTIDTVCDAIEEYYR